MQSLGGRTTVSVKSKIWLGAVCAGSLLVSLLAVQAPWARVRAQPIVPVPQGGTEIRRQGDRIHIEGGRLSSDRTNLFHQLEKLDIPPGIAAQFHTVPEIQNVLALIVGGEISRIDGTIEAIGGSSNLFLINPAGLVFGPGARLNVPGDFLATSAGGVIFGDRELTLGNTSSYQNLVGSPSGFFFPSGSAIVLNQGQLSVGEGNRLALIGNRVISEGGLYAPSGQVIVASIYKGQVLRLSGPGQVLSLEIETPVLGNENLGNENLGNENPSVPPVLSLPTLLTGGVGGHASAVEIDGSGTVRLTGSGIAVESGDVALQNAGIETGTLLLQAANDLTLLGTELTGNGDIRLIAHGTVRIRDSGEQLFAARAGNELHIAAGEDIDILALSPEAADNPPFQALGDIVAIAGTGNFSGDSHFRAGGSFRLSTATGEPGQFLSLFDPIITARGDVVFGDYSGVSLKIEAGGSIFGGDIAIVGPDTTLVGDDADARILQSEAAVILRAGVEEIAEPNLLPGSFGGGGGTVFLSSGSPSGGSIAIASISNSETVILSAPEGTVSVANRIRATGSVTIEHGGGAAGIPFIVGDATENGTGSAIETGELAVLPERTFPGSFQEDTFSIITNGTVAQPPEPPQETPEEPLPEAEPLDPTENPVIPAEPQGNGGTGQGSGAGGQGSAGAGGQGSAGAGGQGSAGANPQAVPDPQPADPQLIETTGDTSAQIPNDLGSGNSDNTAVLSGGQNPDSAQNNSAKTNQIEDQTSNNEAPLGTGEPRAGQADFTALDSEGLVLFVEQLFAQEFETLTAPGGSFGSVETIRETLGRIERLSGKKPAIAYVVSQETELEIILVSPGSTAARFSVNKKREQLLELSERLSAAISVSPEGEGYLEPAQELYKLIIEPMEDSLASQNIDTLLFSVDGGLRSLPLAALHDGRQFLIEKYSLSLIPSINLTDTSYEPNLRKYQILGMGASRFREHPPLPAVPLELSLITSGLWSGELFLNRAFTKENLKAASENAQFGIIHLATHSQFQPGDPGASYIQLADGRLNLQQLREMGWGKRGGRPPLELLVLSACQTAIGDTSAELGFAGLAVAAGVKSALASLWYVSDRGTLGLMSQFYQHLGQTPTKAEALRLAQIAMIRGEVFIKDGNLYGTGLPKPIPLPSSPATAKEDTRVLSHPYYWAAFTMIGSPW